MKLTSNHIILMGFKHVGKSTIGKVLATRMQRNFMDLDQEIEIEYEKAYQKKLSCRKMMEEHGQFLFRELEKSTLKRIIQLNTALISLGGGAAMDKENQQLLKGHILIHIEAPRDVVFERIMAQGKPVFFLEDENPLDSFNRIWNEREKVYQKLANFSVSNHGLIETVVNQILERVNSL